MKLTCRGSALGSWCAVGEFDNCHIPYIMPGLDDALAVSVGSYFGCAVRSAGTVVCWGSNRDGLLGVNFMGAAPTLIASISGAMGRPAASENHTCVAVDDGTVRCCGWNCYGQLGDGTNSLSAEPVIGQGL